MKEVPFLAHRLKSSVALLAAAAGLGGCQSAMQSMVVSNATPESLAITTTQYRGQSCERLAQQLDLYTKEQAKAGGDELMRKSWGWQADAVRTVQNDQGCTPASAAAGKTVPKEMKMYFYCYVTEDIERVNTRGMVKSMTAVFTNVFERNVVLTDPMHGHNLTKAFTDEFRLKVMPSYDLGKTTYPTCAFEDSPTTANNMRQRMRDVTGIGISAKIIDLAWQPTTTVQAASPEKPAAVKSASAKSAALDVPAFGARVEPVGDKAAKAAGLAKPIGAVIASVAPSGPAARAGLKARDIVTDISGQTITRPEDVAAVVSQLGGGTKAPVKLRRGGKALELAVQIPGAPPVASVAATAPVIAAPKPPAPRACAAWLVTDNNAPPKDGVLARFELADRTPDGVRSAFLAFIGQMQTREPGRWAADLSKAPGCVAAICTAVGGKSQRAALACEDTSEVLETRLPHLQNGAPHFRKVEWSPA